MFRVYFLLKSERRMTVVIFFFSMWWEGMVFVETCFKANGLRTDAQRR